MAIPLLLYGPSCPVRYIESRYVVFVALCVHVTDMVPRLHYAVMFT